MSTARKYVMSDEARAKMSAAHIGKKHSPEAREKMRLAKLGKKQSPEHIEARISQLRGRKQSPEHVEARARVHRGRPKPPEQVAKQRQALLQHFSDPANREANRERQRKRWEGKRRVRKGYIQVSIAADHPMASMRINKGYVAEHRLVMAEHLGRPLRRNEHVHHVNFDRQDNRIENLRLMSGSEHMALHNSLRALAWNLTQAED